MQFLCFPYQINRISFWKWRHLKSIRLVLATLWTRQENLLSFLLFLWFCFSYFSDDKNLIIPKASSILLLYWYFHSFYISNKKAPPSTKQSLKRKACSPSYYNYIYVVCISVWKLLLAAPSCGANHGRLPRDSHSLCGECFRHLRGWLSCRSNGAARRQMPFELLDVRRQLTPPKAPVKKPIFPALIQFDLIHLEVRTYISVCYCCCLTARLFLSVNKQHSNSKKFFKPKKNFASIVERSPLVLFQCADR